MQEQRASRTAMATAYMRAAHQILDGTPLVLDDPAAFALLGPSARTEIEAARDRYMAAGAMALRSHVVLRSRYAEDRLALAAARGVTQYVMLGAGFDTFALRQPAWAAALTIVEVDHPDTQHAKIGRMEAAGRSVPQNLRFAACDFERDALADAITRAGASATVPTFFTWLGGTMYMTAATNARLLRAMATFPPGSEAVITFLQPTPESGGAAELAARAAAVGEPMVSPYAVEEMEAALRAAGFGATEFVSAEMSARYFPAHGALPNPRRISIVRATCAT